MTSLDDIRRKKRKKGEPLTLADLTAPDRGDVGSATLPRMPASSPAAPIDSINLVAYLRHVAQHDPQRRALAVARRRASGDLAFDALTFQQLDERTDRLARGFNEAGWGRGQRVMVHAGATDDAVTAIVGLLKTGAVPVLLDTALTRKEIAQRVALAGSPVLLTDKVGLVARYVPGSPFRGVRNMVLLDSWLPASIGRVTPLEKLKSADFTRLQLAATRPTDPAFVAFTSGASRAPRAVIVDHGTFIAQVEAVRRVRWIVEGEVVLVDDIRHALLAISLGATAVMPQPGRVSMGAANRLVSCVDGQAVSTVIGAPATWRAVADHCVADGRQLPNVRQVLLAGGPVNVRTHQSIARILPGGEVRALYGTADAFPIASLGSGEVLAETAALTDKGAGLCLGSTLPGVEAAVIDFGGAGMHVDTGEVGEICVRGALVAPCESLTHEDGAGVWQRTLDLGWRDRQGRLWLVARHGRVVLTRFGPVYPVSCEQVLESHERVRRALVLGVGRPGEQEAVLVVEPVAGAWPKDQFAKISFQKDLLELAQSRGVTREIRRAIFVRSMPTDHVNGALVRVPDVLAWLERTGGMD